MWRLLLLLFAVAAPAAAQSYDENPSGHSIFVGADLRATVADGERSWLDGGFGKGRLGGAADGDARFRARAVEGDVVWQPHLSFALDATVAVIAQDGQDQPVDLSEAFLHYRHAPIGRLKLGARLGYFWPPISLEHGGPAWRVTETITPSAINSWVGEEVKVAGAEASASLPAGAGRLTATASVFGLNDTAGTLLAFRGWALHDEKTTAFSLQRLPPLDGNWKGYQAARTSPALEVDRRPGVYGKLGWATPTVAVSAFYYDNRGDPQKINPSWQWGWRTRFGQVAARVKPGARLTLSAQALTGSTLMGTLSSTRFPVDTRFRSAFLLATRAIGAESSVSARAEAFGTRGRGPKLGRQTDEDGWAATLAGRHAVGEHLSILGEVLHIGSRRDERARLGVAPRQDQTIAQLAARVTL